MSAANVVDSSGWLEYFTDSDRAPLFAAAIEDAENLFVPVISIYEIFKKVLRERGEDDALQVASLMQGGQLIALGAETVKTTGLKMETSDRMSAARSVQNARAPFRMDETSILLIFSSRFEVLGKTNRCSARHRG